MTRYTSLSHTPMTRLFAHLSADVAESLLAVKAHGFDAAVSEHLDDLGILCARASVSAAYSRRVASARQGRTLALLLEDEFTLVALVLVLSSPAVLSSLCELLSQSTSQIHGCVQGVD